VITDFVLVLAVVSVVVGLIGLGWSLNDLARLASERKNLGG
jgi:hypothetical protein